MGSAEIGYSCMVYDSWLNRSRRKYYDFRLDELGTNLLLEIRMYLILIYPDAILIIQHIS